MSQLYYLATPYTKFSDGPTAAYIQACKLAAALIKEGIPCYSPIAHTHPIAVHGGLDPLDLSLWLSFDELMLDRCDILLVAHMDGWSESQGVAHEIAYFLKAGKPVYDMEVPSLRMVKR